MAGRCAWQSCIAGRKRPNGRRSEIARARPRPTRSSCSKTSTRSSSKRLTATRPARRQRRLRRAAPPRGPAGATRARGTGAGQKPSVTEMEERLLATIDLTPETFRGLAQQRAEAARARIAEGAQVDPARLFLVEGGERAKKEGGRHVYFTLK